MKEIKRTNDEKTVYDVFSTADVAEHYAAPEIEIIDIEISENILGSSLPDSEGEPWL